MNFPDKKPAFNPSTSDRHGASSNNNNNNNTQIYLASAMTHTRLGKNTKSQ